jgi:GrpB-like predicted nucleotidyltransferase (UPF0157 family)
MTRRVTVVPYDPRWPQAFPTASAEVAAALGANLLDIHHIGSTAIPGMPAKPVIDMLAVVANVVAIDARNAQMQTLGYESMGEFGIAGRRYFRRDNSAGERTHQVHAFQRGSPHVQRHLAFRDFMRAHPEPAEQYATLKRRLAEAHPNDIEAYIDGKDAFIKEMEARALSWATGSGDRDEP